MSFRQLQLASLLCLSLILSGCPEPGVSVNDPSSAPDMYFSSEPETQEPNFITVQHCLIAFQGTKASKPVERNEEEARKLAEEILARAQGGEDFDKLVETYTDDSAPGTYQMVNHGLKGNRSPVLPPEEQIFERESMVKAFGDVGFKLKVGEVELAPYNPVSSPFGFHIIKRLK